MIDLRVAIIALNVIGALLNLVGAALNTKWRDANLTVAAICAFAALMVWSKP